MGENPKVVWDEFFNFNVGRFVMHAIAFDIQAWPSLELKTRPRFHPVSESLSMIKVNMAAKIKCMGITIMQLKSFMEEATGDG